MDRGAWWATVHRVAKSWTRLSDFTFSDIELVKKNKNKKKKNLLRLRVSCYIWPLLKPKEKHNT